MYVLTTDRAAQFAQEAVDALEDRPRESGGARIRVRSAVGCLPGRVDGADVEDRDFGRLGEQRQPQLLLEPVGQVHPALIHPAAAVAAGLQVLEVADDGEAVVLLQVLVPAGIAGFRARVDPVEDAGLGFQVEAEALEVVVPVGVLDDDFHLRVDGFGWPEHERARGFVHLRQAELGPRALALGGDVGVGLAVGEEEVVQDELVEIAGRELHDLLHQGPVFRIGVAEGLELIALADGGGDAASHLEPFRGEELLRLVEGGLIHDHRVAVRFQIDLVDLHVPGHGGPSGFQPGRILHLLRLVDARVQGHVEVPVVRLRGEHGGERDQGNQAEAGERVLHKRVLCDRCGARAPDFRLPCRVPGTVPHCCTGYPASVAGSGSRRYPEAQKASASRRLPVHESFVLVQDRQTPEEDLWPALRCARSSWPSCARPCRSPASRRTSSHRCRRFQTRERRMS